MAGMQVRIVNHADDFNEAIRAKVPIALEKCGLAGEGYAKFKCPVDTGRLRNSITHAISGNTVNIGSNVEYAAYVELGTSRQRAQPYLTPAVQNHEAQYYTLIRRTMEG